MMISRVPLKPLLMWLLPLSFFAYQFILRLMPSLMMGDMLERFNITATDFGIMSSFYYWGYAAMQIPFAILLDRYAPRVILSLSALVASLGTLLLLHTTVWEYALVGRLCIGMGSAAGFLGISKILNQWFPPAQYSWYVSLSFSVGILGAAWSGRPLALLIQSFGWQETFSAVAFVGMGIAMLLFCFLKSPLQLPASGPCTPVCNPLGAIMRRPLLWGLAVCNLLLVGPLEGFADVWGVPYFIHALGTDKATAAGFCSLIYAGMLFGAPCLALLGRLLRSEATAISIAGFAMAGLLGAILAAPHLLNTPALVTMMFFIGLCCCYQALILSLGNQIVPGPLKGLTAAFLNCINMLGGAFYHGAIGAGVDARHTAGNAYLVADYQFALSIIPLGCLMGAVGILMARRYCQTSQMGL